MIGDEIAKVAAAVPRVSSKTGVFVTMDGNRAVVNLGAGTVTIPCDGWAPPVAGMPVRVESLNGQIRVVGPAKAFPSRATVTAVATGQITVEVDEVEYVIPTISSYVPAVNDLAVIDWQIGSALGKAADLTVAPPGVVVPPTVPFNDLVVQATNSGRYDDNNNNWWGGFGADVWASNSNDGIWVYGGRFSALAGAEIASVDIYLPLLQQTGSASLALHNHPTIPGGAPVLSAFVAMGSRSGWVPLPAPWGNFLRDNPGSGVGVTAPSGGYNRWRGVAGDGLSGALRFAGTR